MASQHDSDLARALRNVRATFPGFKYGREVVIEHLRRIVKVLRERKCNVNVANVTSNAVGVAMAVGTIVLLMVAGPAGMLQAAAILGLASAFTSISTDLIDLEMNKASTQEANCVIDRDIECSAKFYKSMEEVEMLLCKQCKMAGGGEPWKIAINFKAEEDRIEGDIRRFEACEKSKKFGGGFGNAVKDVVREAPSIGAKRATRDVLRREVSGLRCGSVQAFGRVGGSMLRGASLIWDVKSLVETSFDLHKGSPSEIADEFENVLKILEHDLEDMNRRYNELP